MDYRKEEELKAVPSGNLFLTNVGAKGVGDQKKLSKHRERERF